MKTYTIYCHKNKVNGKMYFGQTCRVPEVRFNKGYGYIGCYAFYNAIKKYGWDSFEHIIMFTGLTKIQADYYEKYLIRIYNTSNHKFGYNIMQGGQMDMTFANSNKKMRFEEIDATFKDLFYGEIQLKGLKNYTQISDYLNSNNISAKTKKGWTSKNVRDLMSKLNITIGDDFSARMNELLGEGKNYSEIASILNDEGYTTKQGKEFNINSIKKYVNRKLKK